MRGSYWAAPALAALLTLGAGAASASDNESNKPAPAASDDANKRVCRTVASTGWRLKPARICRTRGEWAELARRNEQEMRDIRRRRSTGASN